MDPPRTKGHNGGGLRTAVLKFECAGKAVSSPRSRKGLYLEEPVSILIIPMKLAIIKEFLYFLRVRKRWWIAPILIFLLLLGGMLIFANGSALAPFIYSLF